MLVYVQKNSFLVRIPGIRHDTQTQQQQHSSTAAAVQQQDKHSNNGRVDQQSRYRYSLLKKDRRKGPENFKSSRKNVPVRYSRTKTTANRRASNFYHIFIYYT